MWQRTLWRIGTVSALALGVALPAVARADGGQSIASATPVTFGQQQFGNLTNGAITKNSCDEDTYSAWWMLPVVSGDQVTVDWEAQVIDYTAMLVYPRGTTDYNYPQTNAVLSSTLNSNAKAEATLTAAVSGSMPVRFTSSAWSCLSGSPGPYDFTAYVVHAIRLSVPKHGSLPRRGTLRIGVHDPDGGAISAPALTVTLQARKPATTRWRNVGKATVTSGVATIVYAMPVSFRHEKASLRATGSGAGYVTQTSAAQRVKIK